ncbi:MAG: sugar transferase [Erythrobacter sp.]
MDREPTQTVASSPANETSPDEGLSSTENQSIEKFINQAKNLYPGNIIGNSINYDFDAENLLTQTAKFPHIRHLELPLIMLISIIVPTTLFEKFDINVGAAVLFEMVGVLATTILVAWMVLAKLQTFAKANHLSYVLPVYASMFFTLGCVTYLFELNFPIAYFAVGGLCAVSLSFIFAVYRRRFLKPYVIVQAGRAKEITIGGQYFPAPSNEKLADILMTGSRNWALVADLHYPHSAEREHLFARSALSGIPVYHYRQILEMQTGQVRVDHLSENEIGSLTPNAGYMFLKRVIDLCVCLILLPALMPAFLLIGLAIKFDSPGSAFFRQKRIGRAGVPFSIIKFRTMRENPKTKDAAGEREEAITKNSDDRITVVGGFLRRTRIDELPQIFNVIIGDMTLIGPRPEARPLAEWYESEVPFYSYRHIVRPGISGWAQVNQGHVTNLGDILAKLRYDFYYIKHISLWLDLLIFLKTIRIIISGKGAR